MHGDGGDGVVVSGIVLNQEVGAHVPHFQRPVCTTRCQTVPLRMKYYAIYSANNILLLFKKYIVLNRISNFIVLCVIVEGVQ